ncbi:hypothetical protein BDY19DRAFT_989934 [Irpex rosettiformis]|uniref:Uncharacterized protein n=1 Tax=Irpex rosettiformis TaxID=378272 RepID=A0ACB8UHW1_9APHY|nr:hypothetical protein BDY19DRAFT_989934 [Irpex rosettiformis]
MFSRIILIALPLLAVATSAASVVRRDGPVAACCSGELPADSLAGAALLKKLGVSLDNTNVKLGLGCIPIDGYKCYAFSFTCADGIDQGVGIDCE